MFSHPVRVLLILLAILFKSPTIYCDWQFVRDRPYITSDGRGESGSAKSDSISKGPLIKHLMRGGTLVPIGVKVAVKVCTLLSYL